MSKYIKVTQKDKTPVVVLAANKNFYASQKDTEISEPTQEEIEQFFPEEKRIKAKMHESTNAINGAETAAALAQAKAETESVKASLQEISEANKLLAEENNALIAEKENGKAALEAELSAHEQTKAALEAAQKQIETLTSQQVSKPASPKTT